MRGLWAASLLHIPGALCSQDDVAPAKRVAIIGAGAGGASTAYHLAQYASESAIPTNITVFERNSYIGGRTTTVNAWDDPRAAIELGGSIFVEVNHIMVEASKKFNLSSQSPAIQFNVDLPELGIWNGREFVLVTTKEDTWWDKAKLLWKYGAAPLWTNRLMKQQVGKFLTMYDEPVFPWSSLSDVVEQVGLLESTGVTGEQYLKANGIGDAFATEIIQASTRVNYASNLAYIHGLETMVCMATNGAMQIDGGNWQIFANMLEASQAKFVSNTSIDRVSKQQDGTFEVVTGNGDSAVFDDVVLAAPLQYSGLVIDPPPAHVPDEIPYTKLHVTLFASPYKLDPKAFAITGSVPQYVLTTLPPDEEAGDNAGSPGFYSISISSYNINPQADPPRLEFIYKIFSPERVNHSFLSNILGLEVSNDEAENGNVNGTVSWILHKAWHSYPKEYPRVTFDHIKLDDGLWYTSAIESFISTMETSALSGKNVARLMRDQWLQKGHGESRLEDAIQEQEPQGSYQVEL